MASERKPPLTDAQVGRAVRVLDTEGVYVSLDSSGDDLYSVIVWETGDRMCGAPTLDDALRAACAQLGVDVDNTEERHG